MNKLAIVADTTMNFTYEMAEKYDIHLVSYYLQIDDKHYKDQVDISSREFYQAMEEAEVLSSGIPPIQEVIDLLDDLKAQGYTQALCMTSSAKLTGMRNLYEVVKSDYQGMELFIYDTEHVSMSSGMLAIYASELNQVGQPVETIMAELDRVKPKTVIYGLFRTLKYLVKGGRFNKYRGMIGNLLHIHPLLKAIDGEIGVADKVRGQKKSMLRLVAAIKEDIGQAKKYRLVLFSGNNDQEMLEFKEHLRQEIKNAESFFEVEMAPVLGVHSGPNSLGVAALILD